LARVFAVGRPFGVTRAAGFGGFEGFRFAAEGAFLAGRFDTAFARTGRRIVFLAGRLRALAAVFFP
jgi:hypothetical protein